MAFGKSAPEFHGEIDVRDLSAGVYFLSLNVQEYSQVVRILKK
jgi:hypothetical protein